MTVPLSTAPVIAAIAAATVAVGILILAVSRRARCDLADQQRAATNEIAEEVRVIANAVIELLRIKRNGRPAPPPTSGEDEDPLERIERIKAEIEAEPGYTSEHIRADLPEGCDRLTWDTPDGPVTAYRRARTRSSGRHRVRGYRGLLAVPLLALGTAWRGITSAPAVGVSMASVGAIAAAPVAIPAIIEQQQPPVGNRPSVPDVHQQAPAVPVRPDATPTPTATDDDADELVPTSPPASPSPSPAVRATASTAPASSPTPAPSGTPRSTPSPTTAPSATTGPPADVTTGRPDRADDPGHRPGHGRPDGPDHPRHNGRGHSRGR